VTIDDLQTYKRPRVQLHAQGIVLRDDVPGALIKTKKQQVCRAGEFLVAEIDAKVGGFGIVPSSLGSSIVSSHYFLFVVDESKLDRRFLDFFTRTPAFREQVAAQGSTNYAAIRPAHVLGYEIPLPPLAEQRRIVARIEALAAKIAEAHCLRQQSIEEAQYLAYAGMKQVRQELFSSEFLHTTLGEVTKVTSGGTPSRDNAAYWGGDIPWVKTGELLDGDILSAEENITQEGADNSSAKIFPRDTVLVALYGQGQTRGRTGRLRISAATNQACCAILPSPETFEARYVQYWLRSLYVDLRETSQGGAQPNWSGGMIKSLEIVFPPLQEQRRIVAYLDDLQGKTDKLKSLQTETSAELNALLPAILDRAFKGEL
jgi:type I restriction enzyme S subunit